MSLSEDLRAELAGHVEPQDAELQRQALIFENIHDAVVIVDENGLILDLNPAAEEMTGLEVVDEQTFTMPADLRGWPWGWYLSRPDSFYVAFMFFISAILTLPSIVLLRRMAQSTTSIKTWVLQKLHIKSADLTRKPRNVWHNPIAFFSLTGRLDPSELDATVIARIPIRTNRDDRYFTDTYQAMPRHGFSRMFARMLAHPNIKIMLNTDYREVIGVIPYREVIFTGPIESPSFRHTVFGPAAPAGAFSAALA